MQLVIMPMFTLPPEIVLNIFSFLQNHVYLLDYYVAFSDIRALMHSHPHVFFDKFHMCEYFLPFSMIDRFFGSNHSETLACAVNHNLVRHVPELLQREHCDPTIDNNDILYTAVAFEYTEIVKLLLADERVDPTIYPSENFIRVAVTNRDTAILHILLEDGRIDPAENDSGALKNAVINNRINAVTLLLKDGRSDPTVLLNNGVSLVQDAIRQGYKDILSLFLNDDRIEPIEPYLLYETHDANIVGLLLEKGRIQSSEAINAYFRYTLSVHSDQAVLRTKACLSHKALDFNSIDNYTAINNLYNYGNVATVKLLIEDGRFDITHPQCGLFIRTICHRSSQILGWMLAHPLVTADTIPTYLFETTLRMGDVDTMKVLLNCPLVDIATVLPVDIDTAVITRSWSQIQLLLDDPRFSKEQVPCTLLMDAVRYEWTDIVRTLLTRDFVDIQTDDSDILHMAVCTRNSDLLQLLLDDPRVDPSIPLQMYDDDDDNDNCTDTLLTIAIHTNVSRSVSLLLQHPKIDPSVNGNAAIIKAAENCNTRIIELLLNDTRVDPTVDDNYTIRMAVENDALVSVKCLYAHPKVADSVDLTHLIVIADLHSSYKTKQYLKSLVTKQ
jgi:hypothetical protein